MKKVKKMLALVIALAMVLGTMGMSVLAEDTDPTGGSNGPAVVPTAKTGTITINNAGIGETYNIYKVLDAEVGAEGAIVYKGSIPADLTNYFEANDFGEIGIKDGVSDADLFTALKNWAANASAAKDPIIATTNVVRFEGLDFGYYVVTSTQGNGTAVSVTSTAPDAVTYEKNTTVPQPTKTVADKEYSIGDTIEYTVTFPGANYMIPEENGTPKPENAKIVTSYVVSDTLPAFLSNVAITSVTIGSGSDATAFTAEQIGTANQTFQGTNKSFTIPWATYDATAKKWTSNYANGTVVTVVYTAKLTSSARVGVDNTNTVTVKPNVGSDDNDTEEPWDEEWSDDETVKTYATAIKKVDEDGKPLAGAKFKVEGLTAVVGDAGVYTVTAYDPTNITLDNSTEMQVNSNGMLYIVGLDKELSLSLTETEAPTGYNKLSNATTVTSQMQTTETIKKSGYRKYDAKGNIVEESETEISEGTKVTANLEDLNVTAIGIQNNKGGVLPSTGGIGTTIFYVVGAILVIGAGVVLVTKRRMNQ